MTTESTTAVELESDFEDVVDNQTNFDDIDNSEYTGFDHGEDNGNEISPTLMKTINYACYTFAALLLFGLIPAIVKCIQLGVHTVLINKISSCISRKSRRPPNKAKNSDEECSIEMNILPGRALEAVRNQNHESAQPAQRTRSSSTSSGFSSEIEETSNPLLSGFATVLSEQLSHLPADAQLQGTFFTTDDSFSDSHTNDADISICNVVVQVH